MQTSPGDAETAPLFVVNGADQPTAVGLMARLGCRDDRWMAIRLLISALVADR